MRIIIGLVALLLGFNSHAASAQAPQATPERPIFTIDGNNLYRDDGEGPVLVIENSPQPLVGVFNPTEGTPIVLATDPSYNNVLIQFNMVYSETHGFEFAGVRQLSNYQVQLPVLFGEDGSIAFVELIPAEQTDSGLPLARVILRENEDTEDGFTLGQSTGLFPNLPVTLQDDGTVVAPILRAYFATSADSSQSRVEVELPTGESLVIDEQGATLIGEDSPAATVHFPDDGMPYAQLGQTVIPVDIQGSYYHQTTHADSTLSIYTTTYADSQRRYYWLYWVSLNPLKVREVIRLGGVYGQQTDPLLEGDTALTPDGQTLLYTAYSDSVGASLWKIDLTEHPPLDYDPDWDGLWYPTPVLLVEGMPFWADAGNFALPKFIEVTDSTVTLEAFSMEDPQPQFTYTLGGVPVERE